MDEEAVARMFLMTQARADAQREFFRLLLRQLRKQVPGFSLDLLFGELQLALRREPAPETAPDPREELTAKIRIFELRDLIALVEDVIKDEPEAEVD